MNNIQRAIEELEKRQVVYQQKIDRLKKCIASLELIFVDTFNEVPARLERTTKAPKPPTKSKHHEEKIAQRRGAKKPFSKYKGVYKGKTRADGTPTFNAGFYKDGKNKKLGTYLIEEEAAAVAAKARGEMDRYRELMAIVEQKENNPDRPKKRQLGCKGVAKEPLAPSSMTANLKTYYECEDCNAEYDERPKACEGCGCKKFNEFQKPQGIA